MAKDNRTIHSGVRVGSETFVDGQEDELAAALSPRDGERLLASGAIDGDWQFTGKEPEPLPRNAQGALLQGLELQQFRAAQSASTQSANTQAATNSKGK